MSTTATLFAPAAPVAAPLNRQDRIRAYLTGIGDGSIPLNPTHCAKVFQALKVVYDNQTATEQADKSTHLNNGVGFNGRDANFGTDLMEKHQRWGGWSPKQVQAVARMLRKYARQIDAGIPEKKEVVA